MTDPLRPRTRQFADFALFIGLALLLIGSAAFFGRVALSFGIEVYSAIATLGVEGGFQLLVAQIQSSAIRDFATLVVNPRYGIDLGLILTLITTVLAPVLFVLLWLRIAGLALAAFKSGIWVLGPRDAEDDAAGPLPDLNGVESLVLAEDFQTARLSQEDRTMLGRNGRHTPKLFIPLQRKLRMPARQLLSPLLQGVFWVILTAAVLASVAPLAIEKSDALWLALPQIATSFIRAFGLPTGWLALALLGLGMISMVLDLRFARALAPRQKPATKKTMEMLRDLTTNSTPEQFLSVLKSELGIRLQQSRITTQGNDGQREGFVDQSSFHLDILIEATPEKAINPAEFAAIRRLWIGTLLTLFGAALPLMFLFPPSVLQLLRMESFSLLGSTSALVWMMLALSAGRAFRKLGLGAMTDAEAVLYSDWYHSPIAAIRIDGTVNTQTAMLGKGQDDSYGAENRIQQCRFDARLISCTLSTAAPKPDEAREITAFEIDAASQSLRETVAALLNEEGSKSTFSAVSTTLQDNQMILEHAEVRKAERKLQLSQLQKQITQLEKEAQEDYTHETP